MRRISVWVLGFLAISGVAVGAGNQNPYNPSGTMSQGYSAVIDPATGNPMIPNPDGSINIKGVPSGSPTPTIPPRLTAYGTLAVTSSSVALSTLTVGPNSPAWSTTYPSGYVSIRNSVASTGTVYFCPLGGTCSASVGEPIAQGETIFRNVANTTAITLFSTAGATVIAEE